MMGTVIGQGDIKTFKGGQRIKSLFASVTLEAECPPEDAKVTLPTADSPAQSDVGVSIRHNWHIFLRHVRSRKRNHFNCKVRKAFGGNWICRYIPLL